ncbi:hypothetical protein [Blastomonas fulva]|uniref:hypothetical protein n=1 Tax=Blastomonas fulva TaxID=1550728 RepID=UPI003F7093D7
MRRSALTRMALALLSGLLLWALWFVLAYSLHGAQCAGALGLSRIAGQIAQVGLWLVALGVIALLARRAARLDVSQGLARTARYLQITAIGATIFAGLPILVLAPC